MQSSLAVWALTNVTVLALAACGNSGGSTDGTGGNSNTDTLAPSAGAGANGGGMGNAGNVGGSPPAGGGAGNAPPVVPPDPGATGATGMLPSGGMSSTPPPAGTTDPSNGGASGGTSGGSGGSDSTDTTPGNTDTETGTSGGETTDGGSTAPPEGAYEACSGAAPPEVNVNLVVELNRPVAMATPRNDANTWYVADLGGLVQRVDMSQGSPEVTEVGTLSVEAGQSFSANECGLLGLALHPNFDGTSERRIYFSYNPKCASGFMGGGEQGLSVIAEYEIGDGGLTLSRELVDHQQPASNHNGGGLAFGPDGYLYISFGDGGGGNNQFNNAQDPNNPLGKILRLDIDNVETPPSGNLSQDMLGGASVDSRIYHIGLRNPWRFSFDRLNGDLYIGDVGQMAREEVNIVEAGAAPKNFGWAQYEGSGPCGACNDQVLQGMEHTPPAYDYPYGGGASVTGGYVYRGQQIPGLWGRYVFGDFVRGDLYLLTSSGNGETCDVVDNWKSGALPDNSLASFAEDADGELYILGLNRGIYRIEPQ